ncbi:MAG: electron transport complex subunit RsxC [Candidatus Omnitrophota bacterium]|nr:electron transport complex subunit RsxC [Candidatus Omnitrophota bacterium]
MINIEEYKDPQHHIETSKFLNPKKLYLPLSQHTGKPSIACVKRGDMVEEAAQIAESSAFISTNLHAPKKGKILNIDTWFHPNLKKSEAIFMDCLDQESNYQTRGNIESLKKEELIDIIKNNGIVGLGGAAFPTYVKLSPPKEIDTFIINGCECEPYLACDYRLMKENLNEIFIGIEIINKIIQPKKIIFAIEENKRDILEKIKSLMVNKKYNLPSIEIAVLKTAYPQGGEKQLIYATTKRKVAGGKLPFDTGCLVHNVATLFAIYEAIYLNKPLIERLVSFAGDSLVSPKNVWVKIGTTLKEIFDQKILKFKDSPKKIICGGPMMGVSLNKLDYPILKGTGGFLFLNKEISEVEESPCIRCGRCLDSCPMNLMPLEYAKRIKVEEYDRLEEYNINDCMECGCCTYTCPSKIPIVQYIKVGKKYLPTSS